MLHRYINELSSLPQLQFSVHRFNGPARQGGRTHCVCAETNEYEIQTEENEMKSSLSLKNMLDIKSRVERMACMEFFNFRLSGMFGWTLEFYAYKFHTFAVLFACIHDCGCLCVLLLFIPIRNPVCGFVAISKGILNWLSVCRCCFTVHCLPTPQQILAQWGNKTAITMPIRDKVPQKRMNNDDKCRCWYDYHTYFIINKHLMIVVRLCWRMSVSCSFCYCCCCSLSLATICSTTLTHSAHKDLISGEQFSVCHAERLHECVMTEDRCVDWVTSVC